MFIKIISTRKKLKIVKIKFAAQIFNLKEKNFCSLYYKIQSFKLENLYFLKNLDYFSENLESFKMSFKKYMHLKYVLFIQFVVNLSRFIKLINNTIYFIDKKILTDGLIYLQSMANEMKNLNEYDK